MSKGSKAAPSLKNTRLEWEVPKNYFKYHDKRSENTIVSYLFLFNLQRICEILCLLCHYGILTATYQNVTELKGSEYSLNALTVYVQNEVAMQPDVGNVTEVHDVLDRVNLSLR